MMNLYLHLNETLRIYQNLNRISKFTEVISAEKSSGFHIEMIRAGGIYLRAMKNPRCGPWQPQGLPALAD